MPINLAGVVLINCHKTSKKKMDGILRQLPSAPITSLTQQDFNHYKSKYSSWACFSEENYIVKIITAIQTNPHIERLDLDKSFTRAFMANSDDYFHHTATVFALLDLIGMENLKILRLDNGGWLKEFFSQLQIFLSDPQCKIERLELKHGLDGQEIEALKNTLSIIPRKLEVFCGEENNNLKILSKQDSVTILPVKLQT